MFFGWSRSRNFGSAPAALAWFQSFATLYLLRISTFYEKCCRKFRIRYRDCCHKSFKPVLYPVLRIRIYYYVDPDPGSQKCPYGSGSKGVNTKEEKLHQKMFNLIFQKRTFKNHKKFIKNRYNVKYYKRILTFDLPFLYSPNELVNFLGFFTSWIWIRI